MKIKPEHYAILRDKVRVSLDAQGWRAELYQREGLSFKRFRWDMLYLARVKIGDNAGMGHGDVPLYEYMNDDHIDTALRRIVTEYGIKPWEVNNVS